MLYYGFYCSDFWSSAYLWSCFVTTSIGIAVNMLPVFQCVFPPPPPPHLPGDACVGETGEDRMGALML